MYKEEVYDIEIEHTAVKPENHLGKTGQKHV